MRKHPHGFLGWTLGLGLAIAATSAPNLAWAKPQNALPKAAQPPASSSAASRARAGGAKLRTQAKKKEAAPCLSRAVRVVRSRGEELEPRELALTSCDGAPNPGALDSLSVLARPRDVERPLPAEIRAYQRSPIDRGPKSKRRNPLFVSARVMRVHPGLLTRLQKVADKFPGRQLEIVSGYRPDARVSSRHHHAHALDFRVAGVNNERLRDFLRSFEQTGVGYYPNSSFVHMDVRDDKGYWVDRSGPGERPDYGVWPPPKNEVEHAQNDLIKSALADLAALGIPPAQPTARAPARSVYTPPKPIIDPKPTARSAQAKRDEERRDEGDDMTASEIARIRRDALKALQALR